MSARIKRRYRLAALMAGALLLGGGVRADTAPEKQIVGTWLTQDKDGMVQIYLATSGMLEGKIVDDSPGAKPLDDKNPDPALRTRPLNGAVILQGFRYTGDGKWTDGTIYDPDNGKTYKCTLELKSADILNVRGYIGMPVFGRSVLWTRVTPHPH